MSVPWWNLPPEQRMAAAPLGLAGGPAVARVRRPVNWALRILAMLVIAFFGLLTLLVVGLEVGPVAFLIGLVMAVLPVPGYLALALWIDRYEPEPIFMAVTTFLWGAAVAVFVALLLNTIGELIVSSELGKEAGEIYGYSISAPIVEESAKAAVLFIIFWWKRDEFDGVIDGIVYAALVGLGFAMTENVLYYGKGAVEAGVVGAAGTFAVRGLLSPFLHPLFTCMTGLGLGFAAVSTKRWVRVCAPIAGLLAAILLHSLWNSSASSVLLIGVYFLFFLPVLGAIIAVVAMALRREGNIVRQYLPQDVGRGLFTPAEVSQLSSVEGRIGASWEARRRGGWRGWRLHREYQSLATELAFDRHKVVRGLAQGGEQAAQREAWYFHRLRELKPLVASPAGPEAPGAVL